MGAVKQDQAIPVQAVDHMILLGDCILRLFLGMAQTITMEQYQALMQQQAAQQHGQQYVPSISVFAVGYFFHL